MYFNTGRYLFENEYRLEDMQRRVRRTPQSLSRRTKFKTCTEMPSCFNVLRDGLNEKYNFHISLEYSKI